MLNNLFLCVNYSNKYQIYFSQPKSWVIWAIIDLNDYISYFLINILIIVPVITAVCIIIQQNYLNIKGKKEFIKSYYKNKLEEFNHAPWVEFGWTIIPLIMLAFMGWPSFKALYAVEQLIDPLHTIVIIGNQWYWSYIYSDFDIISDIILELDSKKKIEEFKKIAFKSIEFNEALVLQIEVEKAWKNKEFFQFLSKNLRVYEESKIMYDCVILAEDDLPLGYPRMLSTDQVLILPSHAAVRLLITSNDVIHSWALPSHGIKSDAIPGRINQINFLTSFWGTYWGQCSELCGINHGFMPIEVRVIPMNDYFDYIRLNVSYRLDKFIPLIQTYVNFYIIYLKNKLIEEKYCFFFDKFLK